MFQVAISMVIQTFNQEKELVQISFEFIGNLMKGCPETPFLPWVSYTCVIEYNGRNNVAVN
jgi:hypothetical protein